ncbi:Stp1/IreP family PP2C-type Ser/Thr phosphatase [Sinimarinibacterium flocculans]|uniref:Protein phosphatase n=1 Tax=Sinimarinibacterium flocculans TaxID=985250 RepID=A0A318EJV7_9GAMM|nr:Stp1/IreP family PP2C-type Ser/Thr phosphatase [Sinimarinibacterium flocculans]PXV71124.1 protein phosphatase [Sinimarinibacterium flocculans]
MALKGKVATALATDTGRVRSNNEDAVGEDPDIGLLVLADGMGGYNAGEIASGISVTTVLDLMRRQWPELRHGEIDADSGHSVETLALREAVEQAHRTIHSVAQSQPQCAGMGTTIVACLLHDDRLSIAYVGDSRLYRFRNGRLEQITRDHSLVEELIARGHYSREDASRLVRKNIVTRALGVESDVGVDLIEETAEIGDVILLCSDGLTDMVDDNQIGLTLDRHAATLDHAALELVTLANAAGGKDNVSVVLARVDSSFARGRRWYERLMEWF